MSIIVYSDSFSQGAVYSFDKNKLEWSHTWGTKDKSLIGTLAPLRMFSELSCRAMAAGYSEDVFYPKLLTKKSSNNKNIDKRKTDTFIPLF